MNVFTSGFTFYSQYYTHNVLNLGVITHIYTLPLLFFQSKNTHFSPLELRFSSIKKTKSKAYLHALTPNNKRHGYIPVAIERIQ